MKTRPAVSKDRKTIEFEGLTPEEILALPPDEIRGLILTGEPLVFRAGTAEILGAFRVTEHVLVVELAQIEGGGEGVLPALWTLAERYAGQNQLNEVEWIVHAVHCAEPNPKLRRVLERRGFVIEDIPGIGEAYHFRQRL